MEKGEKGVGQEADGHEKREVSAGRVEEGGNCTQTVSYKRIRFARRSDQNTLQNATNPQREIVTCRCISS